MVKKIQELFEYRELIVSRVRKDLRGRYKSWDFYGRLLIRYVRLLFIRWFFHRFFEWGLKNIICF